MQNTTKRVTKRVKLFREKLVKGTQYSIDDALTLLRQLTSKKFDETVDVSVNLGVNSRKSDQIVRGATALPSGIGKTVRVAVFAQGEAAEAAKKAGADLVGMDDLSDQIKGGDLNFDVVIATPEAMRKVGALGKILGPRGLMPNPKSGTVSEDPAIAVQNAKTGQIRYNTDKNGIIHGGVGKISFDNQALKKNIQALVDDLKKLKPASSKGIYLKKLTLSTTMGPGISVDISSLGV